MDKHFSKEYTKAIKGIAIILMLTYHLFGSEWLIAGQQVKYTPLTKEFFLKVSNFGNVCVAIFVFLTSYGIASGLVLQKNVTFEEVYRQACSRFLILLRNFLFAYMGAFLMCVVFDRPSIKAVYGVGKTGMLNLMFDALGLAFFIESPTLNETWWYMPIAYSLIFFIPALTLLVKKGGYYVLPLVLLTVNLAGGVKNGYVDF